MSTSHSHSNVEQTPPLASGNEVNATSPQSAAPTPTGVSPVSETKGGAVQGQPAGVSPGEGIPEKKEAAEGEGEIGSASLGRDEAQPG